MSPLLLVILDGWGLAPTEAGNAIFSTPTPNFDQILSYFPHASLHASGEEVGLSWGEMGNSEVGHLNLGTGRIILQDLPRIDKSIQDGTFFTNQELLKAYRDAQQKGSNLHLIGLVSAGGVHSHINHLFALLDLAAKMKVANVFIHTITDGRDTPPKVALSDLSSLENRIQSLKIGKIATIAGRYYAMDRDKRWERTQKAYEALISGQAPKAKSAQEAVQAGYNSGKTDEFIEPMIIEGTPRITDNDSIIFFNFRSDRVKQITDSIINNDFKNFPRSKVLKNFFFVSFTSYGFEPTPNVKVAFFADKLNNQLARILADNNLSQLHVAETEKYPHVTYFFNGGQEQPFNLEERVLIPSPKVATYDLAPEMSLVEVTNNFLQFFQAKKPQFTVLNMANPDMVGHTGNFEATQKAVATVDKCLGLISNQVLTSSGSLIITADHGNAEQMINPQTGEIDKEHTTNPVPVILGISEKRLRQPLSVDLNYKINLAATPPIGVLSDITMTCLDILGLLAPSEMTGQSLKKAILGDRCLKKLS